MVAAMMIERNEVQMSNRSSCDKLIVRSRSVSTFNRPETIASLPGNVLYEVRRCTHVSSGTSKYWQGSSLNSQMSTSTSSHNLICRFRVIDDI
jgi:hypothetical protein